MPKWFWPASRETTSASARAGRVLHWLGYGAGAALLLYALPNMINFFDSGFTRYWEAGSAALLWGSGAIILGRAARYILANE